MLSVAEGQFQLLSQANAPHVPPSTVSQQYFIGSCSLVPSTTRRRFVFRHESLSWNGPVLFPPF